MRIIPLIALAIAALALTGCESPKYPKYEPDQARRAELFQTCLKALPAGPISTQYNDWDEVVAQCSSSAYYQSLYCYENCPPPPAIKKEDAA